MDPSVSRGEYCGHGVERQSFRIVAIDRFDELLPAGIVRDPFSKSRQFARPGAERLWLGGCWQGRL